MRGFASCGSPKGFEGEVSHQELRRGRAARMGERTGRSLERDGEVGLPSRSAKGGPGSQPQFQLLGAEHEGCGTLRGAAGGEPRGEGLLGT